MKLSATYHPIVFLGKKLKQVFPELESYALLYKSESGDLMYNLNGKNIPFTVEEKVKLQNQRKNASLNWDDRIDILKNKNSQKKTQYQIDDEIALNTLSISFKSQIDKDFDQIRFKIPENFVIKNFDKKIGGLSTLEKSILSKLVYQFLSTDYEQVLRERAALEGITNHSNLQRDELTTLKDKYKRSTELFESALCKLVDSMVRKLEVEINSSIKIENDVIPTLINAQLDLEQLDSIIKSAVYTSYNINFKAEEIIVTSSHLNLNNIKESSVSNESSTFTETDKVVVLLNRYEESAKNVLERGKKLNGKNVAAHLSPPVTPPAITEMLKKNERKITFLMGEYPKKWPLIRQSLKPLVIIQEDLNRKYKFTG